MGGGGRNGPPVPSPPRCGAVPPAPPPGWADGDNGDRGARAEARGNAGNGNLKKHTTSNLDMRCSMFVGVCPYPTPYRLLNHDSGSYKDL